MPPDCTRRSFLKSAALLSGASVFLKPVLFAEEQVHEKTEAEDLWAFASDMHISDWTGSPPEHNTRFQSIVAAMLAEPVKPRRLFLLGDNVSSGTPGQYRRLLEILRPLVDAGIGVHAALGDHDHLEHFQAIRTQMLPPPEKLDASVTHTVRTEPWEDGERKHLEIVETKRGNFFVLDSLVTTDQEEGEFGKNQLDWLAAELDQRRDKPAMLMAHHPAVDLAKSGLADSLAFWRLIGTRRQVKAYFFGHAHVWLNLRVGRVHQVSFPATTRPAPLNPLGWVLMTLRDDGVTLTLKTYNPDDSRNGATVNLKWQ